MTNKKEIKKEYKKWTEPAENDLSVFMKSKKLYWFSKLSKWEAAMKDVPASLVGRSAISLLQKSTDMERKMLGSLVEEEKGAAVGEEEKAGDDLVEEEKGCEDKAGDDLVEEEKGCEDKAGDDLVEEEKGCEDKAGDDLVEAGSEEEKVGDAVADLVEAGSEEEKVGDAVADTFTLAKFVDQTPTSKNIEGDLLSLVAGTSKNIEGHKSSKSGTLKHTPKPKMDSQASAKKLPAIPKAKKVPATPKKKALEKSSTKVPQELGNNTVLTPIELALTAISSDLSRLLEVTVKHLGCVTEIQKDVKVVMETLVKPQKD